MCVFADSALIQSVGDWLADLELLQYENTLIGNGYDDMDFMVRVKFRVQFGSLGFVLALWSLSTVVL